MAGYMYVCTPMSEGMTRHSWEKTNLGRVQLLPPFQQVGLSELFEHTGSALAPLPATDQLSSPKDYTGESVELSSFI